MLFRSLSVITNSNKEEKKQSNAITVYYVPKAGEYYYTGAEHTTELAVSYDEGRIQFHLCNIVSPNYNIFATYSSAEEMGNRELVTYYTQNGQIYLGEATFNITEDTATIVFYAYDNPYSEDYNISGEPITFHLYRRSGE